MAAYVANNAVPRADLPALFEGLHASLKRLTDGEVAPPVVEQPTPAVPIRKSVTPDYLICLDDGRKFKSMRRHLAILIADYPANIAVALSEDDLIGGFCCAVRLSTLVRTRPLRFKG